MPSTDAQRRPNLPHRHSLSSVSFAQSPHDGSPRGQKNIKFAVGQGRVGPRVPSGKNLNRLSKLTQARPTNNPSTSPKQNGDEVKRNVSSGQLVQNHSHVPLRKNQSETSLKRNNRSSGQLAKLARPGSSRNVAKNSKRPHRSERSNSGSKKAQTHNVPATPSVRFDLGTAHDDDDEPELSGEEEEEGAWENYTDSRSPSITRASTPRPNSAIASPYKPDRRHPEGNGEPPDKRVSILREGSETLLQQRSGAPGETSSAPTSSPQPNSSHAHNHHAHNHHAKLPQADNIASRLLRRNTSFNNPALPQVSSNSATPTLIGNQHHGSSSSDGTTPEIVSRFLNYTSTSTSTPHNSVFLPSSSGSPEKDWRRTKDFDDEEAEEGLRRNKSFSDVTAMRVSRTQQKLNLERESVVREPERGHGPPLSIIRASRLSSTNIPFYEIGDGASDGRLHPQLRHLFEQTGWEYKRIRIYQNPLAGAVKRLEEVGAVPPRTITTKQKPSSRRVGILSGSGDGTYGLSQSWRSHRSVKSADAKDKTQTTPAKDGQANGHARRPRVMFQGIENQNDGMSDGRRSLDGQQDGEERESRTQRDEVRELCKRLWHKREVGGAED